MAGNSGSALLALVLFPASLAWTQTVTNANGWYMYFGDHPVSRQWGVHLEAQARRSNVLTGWQQSFYRTAVNFQARENLRFATGYAFARSSPYGDLPDDPSHEHRIYQEANLEQSVRGLTLNHRLRLEQRFETPMDTTDWQYRNRVRYQFQLRLPIAARSMEATRVYVALYDEVFLNWGANSPRAFDQNRAYGALGFNLGRDTRLETGYLFQTIARSSGIRELNHTLQFAIFSELPFRRSSP